MTWAYDETMIKTARLAMHEGHYSIEFRSLDGSDPVEAVERFVAAIKGDQYTVEREGEWTPVVAP